MSDLLKPELQVQRAQSRVCLRSDCLDCVALGAQPSETERALGPVGEVRSSSPIIECRLVDVEDPTLASIGRPLGRQIPDGLIGVVRDDVDVAGIACTAHGDVGEFSAAAVGEDVSVVDGRSLHAADGDGVRVVEAVTREFFASEDLEAAVAEADREPVGGDDDHGAALARDEPTFFCQGERHESVAAGVPLASGCFDLGAFDRAGGEAALARAFVEGSDVAPTPGEQDRFAPVS
jgi:hypothetical protein